MAARSGALLRTAYLHVGVRGKAEDLLQTALIKTYPGVWLAASSAPGPTAQGSHEIDELYGLALAEGLRARVIVLSGPDDPSVLPADVYRRLAADLGSNGRVVVADLSGEHASAALAGRVPFLKIAHDEAARDGWAAGACSTVRCWRYGLHA